jgi:hypothetical protein
MEWNLYENQYEEKQNIQMSHFPWLTQVLHNAWN